ncbi:MAG TPA: DUF481 domain-containing protein, partial [bacterium]|nr:DUF481 domain-containing protein [bacterium]
MKRALMVAAVMVVSAVLWGEEPPAPQAVEQEKEDVTPLLREEKVEEKKEEQKEKPVAEEIFSTNERKKKGEKEKKLFFRGDIGFTWVSGNGSSYKNDTLAAYFNMSTTWNDNIAKIILKYDQKILPRLSDQNQSQAEIYQTNRIDLNFDYYLANRWEFFSFTEMESDPTKKLTYRFGVASGIKFVLFRNQYWLFDLGVAPKFEFTTYVDGPQRLKEFRSSSRVKMVFTLHE